MTRPSKSVSDMSWPAGSYAYSHVKPCGSVSPEPETCATSTMPRGRVVVRQKTRLSRKPDTWHYEWDAEDRLVRVTTPDGAVWRYVYDALGRRIAKQRLAADGRSTLEQVTFTWDSAVLCEQTTESEHLPHAVTLTWDHRGLRPLAQTERIFPADSPQSSVDERFFAIVTDLVGAPSELVDESGTLAWRARGTLWGTTTWAASSTTYTPLRFPGQYFDPETGLHYNFHRHYDPEVCRYLSVDPLGLDPAPNPSAYVHNRLTWADPLGLSPCPEVDEISQNIADHSRARAKDPAGFEHYAKDVNPKALEYYVDGVINGDVPTVLPPKFLERGRVAYWDTDKSVVVIEEGNGGTTFTPREGKTYYDELE